VDSGVVDFTVENARAFAQAILAAADELEAMNATALAERVPAEGETS
jgi:hypothetical protein